VAMSEFREVLPEELARRAAAAGSMDALKASGAFKELMAQTDSGQLDAIGRAVATLPGTFRKSLI
jgi:putative transposase